jgi:hypothetical protein
MLRADSVRVVTPQVCFLRERPASGARGFGIGTTCELGRYGKSQGLRRKPADLLQKVGTARLSRAILPYRV